MKYALNICAGLVVSDVHALHLTSFVKAGAADSSHSDDEDTRAAAKLPLPSDVAKLPLLSPEDAASEVPEAVSFDETHHD